MQRDMATYAFSRSASTCCERNKKCSIQHHESCLAWLRETKACWVCRAQASGQCYPVFRDVQGFRGRMLLKREMSCVEGAGD